MIKDISNQKFGRLLAIKPTGEKRWGVSLWQCYCDCGNEHITVVNSLKSGRVKSCGCLLKEVASAKSTKHGDYGSRTYKSWSGMVDRCTNPKNKSYVNYGAKNVKICDEWRDYKNFKNDMGERPDKHSLDRIDVFGDYNPKNCRWASTLIQNRNKRKPVTTPEQANIVRSLYANGKRPKEIMSITGISRSIISNILYLNQILLP
jgi:hypothetical protein